jgi:hypothetical protein
MALRLGCGRAEVGTTPSYVGRAAPPSIGSICVDETLGVSTPNDRRSFG